MLRSKNILHQRDLLNCSDLDLTIKNIDGAED
jgi:hypothetical protein